MQTRNLTVLCFGVLLSWGGELGGVDGASSRELWELSFDELLQVEMSTASRQDESIWRTNASVSILKGEELVDFSRLNLAEGLRQADGVDIGRVSASTWAISSRGLLGEFANRQLVLVDDRQMYSSLFGGVLWDQVDMFLPDLEQVEVVRGAGGSNWGSNAVHGVINAISKSAEQTQGGLFYGTYGESGRQLGARYGWQLGAETFGRVYVKRSDYDASVGSEGQDLQDEWRSERVEFRVDHRQGDWAYLFQGGVFDNRRGQVFLVSSRQPPYFDFATNDIEETGVFLRANGKSDAALGGKAVEWNVYVDDTENRPFAVNERRRSWNGFLSVRDGLGNGWEGILSVDTRLTHVSNEDGEFVTHRENHFDVWKHGLNLSALFEGEDGVSGSLGTRFEYMDDGGLVALPNARFAYDWDERMRIWGSYSRAARFADEEKTRMTSVILYFPPGYFGEGTPEVTQVSRPNAELSEEVYDVLEMGLRSRWGERIQLEASVFHESFEDVILRDFGPVDLSTDPGVQYIDKRNELEGEIYGWEASARWHANEHLRLRAFYGTVRHGANQQEGGREAGLSEFRNYAKHHAFVEARSPLSDRVSLSVFARYFDSRPGLGLDDWVWLDASVSLRIGEEAFVTVSGENLLQDEQQEVRNFKRFESSRFSANWKLSLQLPF
ncbi:TonB-dependent receptor plug domain-containing protein [Pelagicoccus sp. SDUM812005]|uniref:TonB-dependent receptor plug domain-containing protein n=1 Tax=Pelagicoccus sp. SDUM812005 TaxID=3041257 RepID=UPI00280FB89C|nr:TonB-dependent receptor plug domain-containing protein [Pelagicoccus sp. SDUM812005]MDQ8181473.1 TonB-dependent receptor plug domain-containing protein [Pelagicoccus sp. SDUM812005]